MAPRSRLRAAGSPTGTGASACRAVVRWLDSAFLSRLCRLGGPFARGWLKPARPRFEKAASSRRTPRIGTADRRTRLWSAPAESRISGMAAELWLAHVGGMRSPSWSRPKAAAPLRSATAPHMPCPVAPPFSNLSTAKALCFSLSHLSGTHRRLHAVDPEKAIEAGHTMSYFRSCLSLRIGVCPEIRPWDGLSRARLPRTVEDRRLETPSHGASRPNCQFPYRHESGK